MSADRIAAYFLPADRIVTDSVPVDCILVDSIPVDSISVDSVCFAPSRFNMAPVALSTNLLYDALALPNVGVEVYFLHHYSATFYWHYAWWGKSSKNRSWRTYGGILSLRRFFGGKREFTAHHVGVYGQLLLYDFQLGRTGYMSGSEKRGIFSSPTWAAGVEYGYTLPIADRLNLDFSIALGYLRGQYYEYQNIDSHHVWQATKIRHWVGPTNLAVTLQWLLGKKGGEK